MTKFINKFTGTDMWVADDRVEEYKATGHKLVAEPSAEEKKPTRKRTTKK